MKYINTNILLLCFCIALNWGLSKDYKDLSIDFLLNDSTSTPQIKHTLNNKKPSKPYNKVINNFDKTEGLFTLFSNKESNKAYISILPEQLEKIYLAGLTRQSGDGFYLDGSSMLNEYPFMLSLIHI